MSEYFCLHQEHDWKDDQEDIVHLKQVVTRKIKMSPGKGTCQKRSSGFCPLRGGGYPPIPLRKNPSFFHTDFPLRG